MGLSPLVVLHICAGTVGLLAGTAAMTFRKGSRRHGFAGNVFVIAMLSLSASGAYIGFVKSQTTNVVMGILTFYLVGTAWATAKRRDGETGIFDWAALLVALALGAGLITYGFEAAYSLTRLKYGYPAPLYFIFGSVALLSAAGDVRMLVRGGVFGAHRIARHVWRMCLALFIAAGSFFLGQRRCLLVKGLACETAETIARTRAAGISGDSGLWGWRGGAPFVIPWPMFWQIS